MSDWKYEHRHFLRKQPPALEAIPFEPVPPPLQPRVPTSTAWIVAAVVGLLAAIWRLVEAS